MDLKETLLVVCIENSFDTKNTSSRGYEPCIAENRYALNGPPLPLSAQVRSQNHHY